MNFCKHERWEFRRITQKRKDGKTVYMRTTQCLDCGRRANPGGSGIFLPTQGDEHSLEEYDRELERRVYQQEHEQRQENRAKKLRESHHEYEVYINTSPEWQKIRAKVLKRASYLCESCLEAKATQVHHTNYDSLFREIAYELRAVCRGCHQEIHNIRFAPDQPFD